jgi:hypothetical protein
MIPVNSNWANHLRIGAIVGRTNSEFKRLAFVLYALASDTQGLAILAVILCITETC